jgi:hypothetical protein
MWELIPLFGIISGMVMTLAIVFTVARARQRRLEIQAEVQTKLIDRFSSAPELIDFLQSPTGREFVTGVQSATSMLTRERIVSSVGRSIMLIFIGLGFFGMYAVIGARGLMIPAVIFIFLGLGYLAASWVSYRLSLRFGLAEPLTSRRAADSSEV